MSKIEKNRHTEYALQLIDGKLYDYAVSAGNWDGLLAKVRRDRPRIKNKPYWFVWKRVDADEIDKRIDELREISFECILTVMQKNGGI